MTCAYRSYPVRRSDFRFEHLEKYGHNDLKISEKIANDVISIPVHPALNDSDLEKIVSCF